MRGLVLKRPIINNYRGGVGVKAELRAAILGGRGGQYVLIVRFLPLPPSRPAAAAA